MVDRPRNERFSLLFPTSSAWNATGSERDIAVLMSGGVDSSVAALLLREAGHNVVGITMKIPIAVDSRLGRPCCGSEAAFVCNFLGVPHYFIDVESDFRRSVIRPFQEAYFEGRTPNPCVNCNTFLKFTGVWDFLEQTLGVRRLATGHYARVLHTATGTFLSRAADRTRDQSYFLYGIPRHRLPDLVLPMGELSKAAVRRLAQRVGLRVAERPDSMELCFADKGDYRRALPGQAAQRPGPILDTAGKVLGQHNGIFNYTIGQRRGLGISSPEPLYVIRISPSENSVTVGTRAESFQRIVRASGCNVLIPELLRPGGSLLGKIRSYGEPAPCAVKEAHNGSVAVEFDAPQFAPTPGQHLVLYESTGSVVAGGAIVSQE